MDVPEPTLPEGHPGRARECADSLDMALAGLWEFFEDAGWTEEEFNLALLEVAKRHSGDNHG